MFGQTPAQTGSPFGQPASQPGSFFGQTSQQSGSLFGQNVAQTGSPSFGSPGSSSAVQPGTSLFGTGAPGGFGTSPGVGSAFGSTSSTSSSAFQQVTPFGQNSAFSGKGGFGHTQATPSTGSSLFGQGSGFSGSPLAFGQTQASSASGTSPFGQGPGFTGTAPFGQVQASLSSGTSGFGQGSAFSGASAFGQPQSTASGTSLFGQGSGFSGTVAPFGQSQATTTTVSAFGQGTGFGGVSAFGQPQTATVSTSGISLFGQRSGAAGAFSPVSTASSSLFRQSSPSTVKPVLFGQTATTGQGQATSAASSTLFGQSSSISQTSSTAATSASAFAFVKTTASSAFGSGGSSAFQSTASAPSAFGQLQTSTGAFGKPSAFSQQGYVGTGASAFGTIFDIKPSTAGLFGKGQDQTTTETATSAGQSRTRLVSGGFAGLFGKKEKTEDPGESTGSDQKPVLFGKPQGDSAIVKQEPQSQTRSLFGKPQGDSAVVKQEPQSQARPLFGKGPPDYQDVKTKQEKPQHTGLFGRLAPAAEPEGARKTGLFGKGGGGQQGSAGSGDEGVSQSRGSTARQVKAKEERQPQRTFGLFGKGVPPKPATKGLFGKQPANEDSDRDTDESTESHGGFRPRLTRVKEDTGRSLFGKPVTQSTRQSRGSDEGLKARRGSLTRQVSEDRSRKVAITCKDIPTKFNNNIALRNHFCRFGKVTKVFPNPSKMQATIHFDRHEQAADAKRRGRILARGFPPMTIFWSSYLAPLSPSPSGTSREQGQGTDDEAPTTSRQSDWRKRDPVNDELQGMMGTRDLKYNRKKSPSPGPWETGPRSPEKRTRSASPAPGTSVSADVKGDKVIQLGTFHGLVAKTTSERVHLLTLRDKYIRQNKKSGGKDMKKKMVGTCPDMCPEKERYNREDKRQLHYYEMVPGTENIPRSNPLVDHSRAVKEYLRSSPGEDEPLPHELRPLPVLQMTMTYLLREIADQGQDGYWADWFDFLWNRTRGIRKDITQQQLCDRGAVELIEKCARFHIFCSERLCEEDMHSFDAKINNENLTKCLQTLREFYHDLERKQKVFCPCEAEFRAYTVLMNLNGGDILREVQQLRPEVRSRPEIHFALQVYSALNSNNYVRFFRLVKQSSFSNACIMHRYFTQVRNRALTSMMRTYGMGNKPAQIPLSDLVRLLGFESEQEASDFAEHYGFVVEDSCVILDKNDYVEPDTAWLTRRSVSLIESKRMVSVGEMINGEALPSLDLPPPSSSFDEQGRFKSAVELPGRAPATAVEPEQPVAGQEPVTKAVKLEPTVPDQPAKPAFTNEHVKDMAKLLFWEVIDGMCQEIGREEFDNVQNLLDVGQSVLENTVYSTVTDMLQSISKEVHDNAKIEHQRALEKERAARCDRVAKVLKEELWEEVLKEQVLSLATIEIREVKAQLKRESIARVTEEINHTLVQEVMTEMVQECATSVYETDVIQRLRQLQELEGIVKLSRAGKFFKRWKNEYKSVTKLKRAMMEFPSAPSMEKTGSQLDSLVPNRKNDVITETGFYINQTGRLTTETPVQAEERRKRLEIQTTIQALYQRLRHSQAWLPLDMGKLVGTKLVEKYRRKQKSKGLQKVNHLYWKLVIYLPEQEPAPTSQESRAIALLCDWLKAKLSKGKKPPPETVLKTEVLSLYKTKVTPQPPSNQPTSLGICVRSISGLPTEDELLLLDEERCMLGTCGIVFVLPANPPFDDPYSDYWYTNMQRLQELLEVKPSNQDFPLVIIVAASANQDVSYNNLSQRLNLDLFIEQGFICDVKVLVLDYDYSLYEGVDVVEPQVSEKLCECMEWLSDLTNVSPSLTVSYLKDCIDTVLMEHYYTPVLQNLRKRKILGHLHQSPKELLELYNVVIQHLCDILTSESLLTLSWPVAEFTKQEETSTPPPHWNTEDQFEYLTQLIGSLKLPDFVPFPSEPSWEAVRERVFNYANSVVDGHTGPAKITLLSRLNKLLQQVEVDFEDTCYLTEGLDSCEPSYSAVPWTELVSMCIDYRLATLDFVDPSLNTQGGKDEELKVAYFQSELDNFVPPQAWRHIESEQSILESQSIKGMIQSAAKKAQDRFTDATRSNMPAKVDQENIPPEVKVKETKTSSSLIKSLQAERRRSDHFQKYLENALKSDQEPVIIQESMEVDSRKSKTPKMFGDSFRMPGIDKDSGDKDIDGDFHESEWKSASADMFGDSLADNRDFSMIEYDPYISMGARLFGNRTIHFNDESCFGTGGGEFTGERKRKSFGQPQQSAKRFSLGVVTEIDATNRDSLIDVAVSTLSSKARKQRLSDIYGNDKVMFALCEPSVDEGIDSLKDQIKANRRESDIFEEKLRAAMKADPFTC